MNSPELAQKIHNQAGGNTVVISRADWPDDTFEIDVDRLISMWQERNRYYPDIYHYYPNEPIVDNEHELRVLLGGLIRLMRKLREAKIKAVIGNFSWSKILYADEVDAGLWDEFIKEASLWTNEGWGYIGGHDYTWGVIPFGAAARNPYDMLYPTAVQPDYWPTYEEVRQRYNDNWLMLRWMMLTERAENVLNVPMFKMIITETPVDRMPNLEQDVEVDGETREGVISMFDSTHGYTRGPLSQRNLYDFWFPQWSQEESLMNMLVWMDEVYPSYVHGFTLFAINSDRDWTDFNFYNWPEMLALLSEYEIEAPDPIDRSDPQEIMVTPLGDYPVNIRTEPNIKSNIAGKIAPGIWTPVTLYPNNPTAGENQFRPIRWNGDGKVAYAAFRYLDWEPYEPVPEPEPEPEPEVDMAKEIAEILEAYENLGDEIEDITGSN